MDIERLNTIFEKLSENKDSSDKIPPSRKKIIQIIKDVHYLMFPEYFPLDDVNYEKKFLAELFESLKEQISVAFSFSGNVQQSVSKLYCCFFGSCVYLEIKHSGKSDGAENAQGILGKALFRVANGADNFIIYKFRFQH